MMERATNGGLFERIVREEAWFHREGAGLAYVLADRKVTVDREPHGRVRMTFWIQVEGEWCAHGEPTGPRSYANASQALNTMRAHLMGASID